MKGQSNCEICGLVFEWERPKTRKTPRFCSHECRLKIGTGFRPGGQIRISELSEEQKFERLKKSYEKHVIRQEGCWGWKGPLTKFGYAVMSCRPSIGPDKGHRASWIIHKGKVPEGMHVCHSCDNPICTNPDHLWLGTFKENNDDKIAKGRARYVNPPIMEGSKNPASKLSESQVIEIKDLISKGNSCYSISKKYTVSSTTIKRIKNGKNWTHIKE